MQSARPANPPAALTLRRNVVVDLVVITASSLLLVIFLDRTQNSLDLIVAAALATVGIAHLLAILSSYRGVFSADGHGVRLHYGGSSLFFSWDQLQQIVVEHPRSAFGAGRLVLIPLQEPAAEQLPGIARLAMRWSQRRYGVRWCVPLGMESRPSTRRTASHLHQLTSDRVPIIELPAVGAERQSGSR